MNAVKEGSRKPRALRSNASALSKPARRSRTARTTSRKLEGPNRGRGVAAGFWFNAGLQSSAVVNIHADGTASVVTGSVDIGGSRASMAMITAEVLGLEINEVRPLGRPTPIRSGIPM